MRILALFLLLNLLCFSRAGKFLIQDAGEGPKNFSMEQIFSFSKKVEESLAAQGVQVAIVSRIGRPKKELPEGVTYTHVGYWVYSTIQTADGKTLKGYQSYNLYQRKNQRDRSDLVQDFPVDFFLNAVSLEAGIIIPTPELQEKLLAVITSDTYKKLYDPHYSVVANPANLGYQNCTEHILDVLVSAVYNTDNPQEIKDYLAAYFIPQDIKLSRIKTMLGPIFIKDFTRKDQVEGIKTATFTTIAAFMEKNNFASHVYYIKDN